MNILDFGTQIALPDQHLIPDAVLYDFEGPRIFSIQSSLGSLLAYVVEDLPTYQIVLLSPTTATILRDLKAGRSTVREAMDQSWSWLAERNYDGQIRNVVSVQHPSDMLLPPEGVMLYRHLRQKYLREKSVTT